MDADKTHDHLQVARRHVAQGERHVARQRELVAELERDGHDSAQARALLRQFEETQQLHIDDRDRLEKELAEISKRPTAE